MVKLIKWWEAQIRFRCALFIDLVFYVSPSARSNQTIIKDGGAEKIFIEGTKDNILSLVERIFKMRDDIY